MMEQSKVARCQISQIGLMRDWFGTLWLRTVPHMKMKLKGCRFERIEEIRKELHAALSRLSQKLHSEKFSSSGKRGGTSALQCRETTSRVMVSWALTFTWTYFMRGAQELFDHPLLFHCISSIYHIIMHFFEKYLRIKIEDRKILVLMNILLRKLDEINVSYVCKYNIILWDLHVFYQFTT